MPAAVLDESERHGGLLLTGGVHQGRHPMPSSLVHLEDGVILVLHGALSPRGAGSDCLYGYHWHENRIRTIPSNKTNSRDPNRHATTSRDRVGARRALDART